MRMVAMNRLTSAAPLDRWHGRLGSGAGPGKLERVQ